MLNLKSTINCKYNLATSHSSVICSLHYSSYAWTLHKLHSFKRNINLCSPTKIYLHEFHFFSIFFWEFITCNSSSNCEPLIKKLPHTYPKVMDLNTGEDFRLIRGFAFYKWFFCWVNEIGHTVSRIAWIYDNWVFSSNESSIANDLYINHRKLNFVMQNLW